MAKDLGCRFNLLIVIIVSFSLTACEFVNTEDRPDSVEAEGSAGGGALSIGGANDPAFLAFEATVYPVLSNQLNCNTCHGSQVPRIAAAANTAWSDIVAGNWIQEGVAPANNPIVLFVNGHNANTATEAGVISAAIADWQSQMALIPTEDLVDYGDDSLVYYFEE